MTEESTKRLAVSIPQLFLLCGALVTVTLGFVGWTQLYPGLPLDERLYLAFHLLTLSYVVPVDVRPPLALNAARFLAQLLAFYAFGTILHRLFNERGVLWRAARLSGHVVIVGDGPEVPDLAINYRNSPSPKATRVVILGSVSDEDRLMVRRHGVLVITAATLQNVAQILHGATTVVVDGSSDRESARLAARVEKASGDQDFPTTVLFEGRDITQQWNRWGRFSALCKSRQLAIATLRRTPPRLEDRVCPPPIVIGDGPVATEIARRIVEGWQQPGERMTVHCLGENSRWVDNATVGIEDRADCVWIAAQLNPEAVVRIVRGLFAKWQAPPPAKATATGPSILVVLDDTTRSFPIAAILAEAFPDARVAAIVHDAEDWQERLSRTWPRPLLISYREQLTDPAVLALTPEELLAEEILWDASRWPVEVTGLFGTINCPDPSRAPKLGEQEATVRDAIGALAAAATDILSRGDIQFRESSTAESGLIVLDPEELIAMRDRILAVLEDFPELPGLTGDEKNLRALELASRLPALAALAGWAPHRRFGHGNLLMPEEINQLAQLAHAKYQDIAERTRNARGSDTADKPWELLSAFERETNRAQVMDIPVKLAVCGLSWRRSANPTRYRFTDEQVEQLAALEHRRWEHHQYRNGRPGHTWLKPWVELPEDVREYEREPIREMAAELASVGIEIFEPKQ